MALPKLNIKIVSTDEDVVNYYKEACNKSIQKTDISSSGFDLIVTEDIEYIIGDFKFTADRNVEKNFYEPKTMFLKLGIACSPNFSGGYDLVPRSSIFKTPIRMSNSIGIIDNGYRGEICAPIDIIPSLCNTCTEGVVYGNEGIKCVIKKGTRLFQLVHGSRLPLVCEIVNNLNMSERGTGGFGSTGKTDTVNHLV